MPVPLPPPGQRPGTTLIELLVVLLLLGVMAAVIAPAMLRERADDAQSASVRVIAFARAAAVRRGETLALSVAADGRWTLRAAQGDSIAVDSGVVAVAAMPHRLLVTPLGLCLPDDDAASAAPWDPTTCARSADMERP